MGLTAFIVNHLPESVITARGEPYLAGHSLEEGIGYMKEQWLTSGIRSSLDFVKESAFFTNDADFNLNMYLLSLPELGAANDAYCAAFPHTRSPRRPFSVSVKPSSISVVSQTSPLKFNPETPFETRLEYLVTEAEKCNVPITVDMEDHNFTDATLEAVHKLWSRGHKNVSVVLQSRMYRTREDIHAICQSKYGIDPINEGVRICIGIYREPKEIAFTSKRQAKERLLEDAAKLLEAGRYVEFATHDFGVVKQALEMIQSMKIEKGQYEFQLLKGPNATHQKIVPYLLDQGESVMLYAPVELNSGDGNPYMRRRLIANPNMFWVAGWDLAKSIPRRMFG